MSLNGQVLHTLISFTEGSEENIEYLIKQANIADVANPLYDATSPLEITAFLNVLPRRSLSLSSRCSLDHSMQLSYFNEVQTLPSLKLAQEQIKVITVCSARWRIICRNA
jgi:hypothetical protein